MLTKLTKVRVAAAAAAAAVGDMLWGSAGLAMAVILL
jgi:hypothetical protein